MDCRLLMKKVPKTSNDFESKNGQKSGQKMTQKMTKKVAKNEKKKSEMCQFFSTFVQESLPAVLLQMLTKLSLDPLNPPPPLRIKGSASAVALRVVGVDS